MEIGGLNIQKYGGIAGEIEQDRTRRFRDLFDSGRGARFIWDANWACSLLLYHGKHWITEGRTRTTSGGRTTLRMLPADQTDGGPDDVRVTVNRIRDITDEITSILQPNPDAWKCLFEPDGRDATRSAEDLALEQSVWEDYCRHTPPAEIFLSVNRRRNQCGSGLWKAVPDTSHPYGWDLVEVPPDRMIWDPANTQSDLEKHNEWADTMAWPAEDVSRAYGLEFPKPDQLPTLGSLRAFESATRGAQATRVPGADESKVPAVLLTEYYWPGPPRPGKRPRWSWLTLFIHTGTAAAQMHILWDGPNPYGKCPFLKVDFGDSLLSPWGTGVPLLQKPENQILNQAMTHVIRHLLTVQAIKQFYAQGSIENPRSALSPKVGGIVEIKKVGTDWAWPQYSKPPDLNQVSWQLVALMPEMMAQKAHLRDVMMGITSPRGESNAAILSKLGQAGRTFVTLKQQDEERIRRFLTYHVRFLCETAPAPRLLEAVGPDRERLALRALSRRPRVQTRISVSIRPGLAKTPQEKEQSLKQWASLGLFDAEALKWEIFQQTGEAVTAEQYDAAAAAAQENAMLLAGATAEDVDAVNFEPHWVHIPVHRQLINHRRLDSRITPDVVTETIMHLADHYEEWGDEKLVDFGLQAQGNQGAAGMVAQATGAMVGRTPVGGAMAAPEASPVQYGARELANQAQAVPVGAEA